MPATPLMSTPTWGIPAICLGEGGARRCGAVVLVLGVAGPLCWCWALRGWTGAGQRVTAGLVGWPRGTAELAPPPSARHHLSARACAYTTSMRAPVFSAWIS